MIAFWLTPFGLIVGILLAIFAFPILIGLLLFTLLIEAFGLFIGTCDTKKGKSNADKYEDWLAKKTKDWFGLEVDNEKK